MSLLFKQKIIKSHIIFMTDVLWLLMLGSLLWVALFSCIFTQSDGIKWKCLNDSVLAYTWYYKHCHHPVSGWYDIYHTNTCMRAQRKTTMNLYLFYFTVKHVIWPNGYNNARLFAKKDSTRWQVKINFTTKTKHKTKQKFSMEIELFTKPCTFCRINDFLKTSTIPGLQIHLNLNKFLSISGELLMHVNCE